MEMSSYVILFILYIKGTLQVSSNIVNWIDESLKTLNYASVFGPHQFFVFWVFYSTFAQFYIK